MNVAVFYIVINVSQGFIASFVLHDGSLLFFFLLRLVPLSRSGFTHCSSTIVGVKSAMAPFIILPLVLDTLSWQLVAAEETCVVPFATSLRVSYR